MIEKFCSDQWIKTRFFSREDIDTTIPKYFYEYLLTVSLHETYSASIILINSVGHRLQSSVLTAESIIIFILIISQLRETK